METGKLHFGKKHLLLASREHPAVSSCLSGMGFLSGVGTAFSRCPTQCVPPELALVFFR